MTDLTFIYETAREYGRDPSRWPADIKRDVVSELFRKDHSWAHDALASLEPQVLRDLMVQMFVTDDYKHNPEIAAQLIAFPMDWFAEQIADNYGNWLAEQKRLEREAELSDIGDAA